MIVIGKERKRADCYSSVHFLHFFANYPSKCPEIWWFYKNVIFVCPSVEYVIGGVGLKIFNNMF
jgi:hypothetical protein